MTMQAKIDAIVQNPCYHLSISRMLISCWNTLPVHIIKPSAQVICSTEDWTTTCVPTSVAYCWAPKPSVIFSKIWNNCAPASPDSHITTIKMQWPNSLIPNISFGVCLIISNGTLYHNSCRLKRKWTQDQNLAFTNDKSPTAEWSMICNINNRRNLRCRDSGTN